MSARTVVLLACGHWYREGRPDGLAAPASGEERCCAHPDHYPRTYPAVYLGDIDLASLGSQWADPS